MVVLSVILMLGGAISVILGIMQNNSLEAQLASVISSGKTNPGTMWIVIGVIAVVVGIILLVVSRKKKNQ